MNRTTWFPRGAIEKRRPVRCRLQVERLEDRNLMSFQVLATLGDPVSLSTGPAFRINDFEPDALNNKGDIVYGNDLGTANDPSTFFGEDVFLRSHGQETVLASSTAPAPGGGTFDFGFLGPATLNNHGDAAVDFLLQPVGAPFGVNAGAYRYSHTTQTVTAVVVPGVTPVPEGGAFAGTSFGPSLDNRGDLFFVGIVATDKGIHIPGQPYVGLGEGVYEADQAGKITTIVSPGDPAPGGGTFDNAGSGVSAGYWVNGRGDIAFTAHVAGEEAQIPGFPPQSAFIAALASIYVKSGATGQITSIAHAGDPAPGGGVFRQAYFPGINDRGDVVFSGDLTPAPDANMAVGIFLYSGGKIIPIARPGDAMPGGGHFVTASTINGNTHVNNQGDVVFNAALDTTHNGVPDTGLFKWSHGQLVLIARSGTILPGVGTVDNLTFNEIVIPPPPVLVPTSGAIINDGGQVLFGATLTDGRGVMLLDTPSQANGALSLAPVSAASTGSSTAPTGTAAASDVALAIVLSSRLDNSPVWGAFASSTSPALSTLWSLAAPAAGHDSTLSAKPSQGLSTLSGALPVRGADALFASLGDRISEDLFSGGLPLL
jgi:hypothetical protein